MSVTSLGGVKPSSDSYQMPAIYKGDISCAVNSYLLFAPPLADHSYQPEHGTTQRLCENDCLNVGLIATVSA